MRRGQRHLRITHSAGASSGEMAAAVALIRAGWLLRRQNGGGEEVWRRGLQAAGQGLRGEDEANGGSLLPLLAVAAWPVYLYHCCAGQLAGAL